MTYERLDTPRMDGTNAIQVYITSGGLYVLKTPTITTETGVKSAQLSSNRVAGLVIAARISGNSLVWDISKDSGSNKKSKSEVGSFSLTVASNGSSDWDSSSIVYTIQVYKFMYAYDVSPSGIINQGVLGISTDMPSPLYPNYIINSEVYHLQNSNSEYLHPYHGNQSNGLSGTPEYPGSYQAVAEGYFMAEPSIKPVCVSIADTRVYTDQEKLICVLNKSQASCDTADLRIVDIDGTQGVAPFEENPGNGFNIGMSQISLPPSAPVWEASYTTSDGNTHNYRVYRKTPGYLDQPPNSAAYYIPSVWAIDYNGTEIDSAYGVVSDEEYPPSSGWSVVTLNRNPAVYHEDYYGNTTTYEYVGSGDCFELAADGSIVSTLNYRLEYYVSNDYVSKTLPGVQGTYGGSNVTGGHTLTYDPTTRLWCDGVCLSEIEDSSSSSSGTTNTVYDDVYPIAGVGTLYAPINGSWMDIGAAFEEGSSSTFWGFAVSNDGTGVQGYSLALSKGDHYEGAGMYTKKPLNSLLLPYSNQTAATHELKYTTGHTSDYGEIYYTYIQSVSTATNVVGTELWSCGATRPAHEKWSPINGTYQADCRLTVKKNIRVSSNPVSGTIDLLGDNHTYDITNNFFGIDTSTSSPDVTISIDLSYIYHKSASVGYDTQQVIRRVDYKGILFDQFWADTIEYDDVDVPPCPLPHIMSNTEYLYTIIDRPIDDSISARLEGTDEYVNIPYICPGSDEDISGEIHYDLLKYTYIYSWSACANEVVLTGLTDGMSPLQLDSFIWDDGKLHYNEDSGEYIPRPDVLTAYDKYGGSTISAVYGCVKKAVYKRASNTVTILKQDNYNSSSVSNSISSSSSSSSSAPDTDNYEIMYIINTVVFHKCGESEDLAIDPETGNPRVFQQNDIISEGELTPVFLKDLTRTYDIELNYKYESTHTNGEKDPAVCNTATSGVRTLDMGGSAIVTAGHGAFPGSSIKSDGLSVKFDYPNWSCTDMGSECTCLDTTDYNLYVTDNPAIGISWANGAQEMCKAYNKYINIQPGVSVSISGHDKNIGPSAVLTGINALYDRTYLEDFEPIPGGDGCVADWVWDDYDEIYDSECTYIPVSYHPLSIIASGTSSHGGLNTSDVFSSTPYTTGFLSTHFPDLNLSNTYTSYSTLGAMPPPVDWMGATSADVMIEYTLKASLKQDSDSGGEGDESSYSDLKGVFTDRYIEAGDPLVDATTEISAGVDGSYKITPDAIMGSIYPFEGPTDGSYRAIMSCIKLQHPPIGSLGISKISENGVDVSIGESDSEYSTDIKANACYSHNYSVYKCRYPYCGFYVDGDHNDVQCKDITFKFTYSPDDIVLKYIDDTAFCNDVVSKNPSNITIDDAITGAVLEIDSKSTSYTNVTNGLPNDIGDATAFVNCYHIDAVFRYKERRPKGAPPGDSLSMFAEVYAIPERSKGSVPVYTYEAEGDLEHAISWSQFESIGYESLSNVMSLILDTLEHKPKSDSNFNIGTSGGGSGEGGSGEGAGSDVAIKTSDVRITFLWHNNIIRESADVGDTIDPYKFISLVEIYQKIRFDILSAADMNPELPVSGHEMYTCPDPPADSDDDFVSQLQAVKPEFWNSRGFRIYYKK